MGRKLLKMTSLHTPIAIFCVIFLAVGQILFKFCAQALSLHGLWHSTTIIFFCTAIFIYGITTLAWIWVLSTADLGRVYPLTALGFVFVPLACYFLFREQYSLSYLLGVVLIIAGVVLTRF